MTTRIISSSPDIDAYVEANAPVAIGVSGGKDSCAVAIAIKEWLRERRHCGPVLLIHSDLGMIEWTDSMKTCQRLAEDLGLELVIVRRKAGGMLERWEKRWEDNVDRWLNLECVKLILPWSTPSMRFCTSELKTDVICSYLRSRFGGKTILSVTGIRADESPSRAIQPVYKEQPKLRRPSDGTRGFNWNPIRTWTEKDVFDSMQERGFKPHEAYVTYGSSRVSCSVCIMSSLDDLKAAASCPDNLPTIQRVADLEMKSGFSFQGSRWLTEVVQDKLSMLYTVKLAAAKTMAAQRQALEAQIPKHLEYTKGWPTVMPTQREAELLAEIRTKLAQVQKLPASGYNTTNGILERYKELMNEDR